MTQQNCFELFIYFMILIGCILVYFSIRNCWVLKKRCEHIFNNNDEFTQLDKIYSYDKMLFKYFYIWNYKWFIKQLMDKTS
jgi:hypothetical protein